MSRLYYHNEPVRLPLTAFTPPSYPASHTWDAFLAYIPAVHISYTSYPYLVTSLEMPSKAPMPIPITREQLMAQAFGESRKAQNTPAPAVAAVAPAAAAVAGSKGASPALSPYAQYDL